MVGLTRIFAASLTFLSVMSVAAKRSHFSPTERHIKRATIDVCVYVEANLAVEVNSKFGLSIPTILGGVNACICVSAVPGLVQTNAVLSAAAVLKGKAKVATWLIAYINGLSGAQTCTYPTNAIPACSKVNVCDFTCTGGLTRVEAACQCVAPKVLCNGLCTNQACPTGLVRRENNVLVRTSVCPVGTEKCGVLRQSSSSLGYECLNTQSDLESCGGCVTPRAGEEASGQDCTAIPGIAGVECSLGKCVVGSCLEGWNTTNEGQACERVA